MKLANGISATITGVRSHDLELSEYGWGDQRVKQVKVELDKGSRHGIQTGYYGYLVNEGGRPVRGSRFLVEAETDNKAYGYVFMKESDVQRYPQAVISEEGMPRKESCEPARLVSIQTAPVGGMQARINKGSWEATVDGEWTVTARKGMHKAEFEIDRVTQTETHFIAPETFAGMQSYTDWKLERRS